MNDDSGSFLLNKYCIKYSPLHGFDSMGESCVDTSPI